MAYTLDIVIPIGITGLTDLRGQLFSASGNVGSAVSTGFSERGTSGNYLWHYTAFPDGHRGGVEFYSNADPTTILAVATINPEEAEYTDVKTSTRLASASYTAPDNATIASIQTQIGVAGAGLTALPGMMWANATRTLTGFGSLAADVAAAVWAYATRTLTGSVGATAADIWSYATRTLTAFGVSGLTEFTYTVTNSVTTLPISNVEVWISTDNAMANVVWYGVTDAFGVARDAYGNRLRLNAGTYYVWRRLSGFTFNDPDVEVIG